MGAIYDIGSCLPPEVCPNGEPTKRPCGEAGDQVLDWTLILEEELICWWSCCKKINVQINGYYSMETTRGLYQQFDTFNDDVPIVGGDGCPCGQMEKTFYKSSGVQTKFTFVPCGGARACLPCNDTADNSISVTLKHYTKSYTGFDIYVQVPEITIGPNAYGAFPCRLGGLGANQRLKYFDTCVPYPIPILDALACGQKHKVARWRVTKKTWTYTVSWSWTTCRPPADPCADCNSCHDGKHYEGRESNCGAGGSCSGSQGCRSPGTHDKRQTGSITLIITNTENCQNMDNRCKKC
jgi:hypothetical protein